MKHLEGSLEGRKSKTTVIRCPGCSIDLPASEMKIHVKSRCQALEDGSNNHLLDKYSAPKEQL